jgi:hypothetical protein
MQLGVRGWEGWTRTAMIFLLIVVVAGIVAMWNRSRYHP